MMSELAQTQQLPLPQTVGQLLRRLVEKRRSTAASLQHRGSVNHISLAVQAAFDGHAE